MTILDNIKNTEIKNSTLHNKGLFATKDIMKGSLLCILSGQKMTRDEYTQILKSNSYDKENFVEKYNISSNFIGAMPFRTKYSMINHSSISNISSELINEELHVFASEDILKGTEITDTYNLDKHIDVLGGFNK